jgi:DNA-binding NarL/FixJ family response regulator
MMTMRAASLEKVSLGRILLVEDEELQGEHLRRELVRNNIECVWAKDFDSAVKQLNQSSIHCVVTDVFLRPNQPEGLKIVELANQNGIPSIIITSALDLEVAKKGLNNGADYLFEKPLSTKDLLKSIDEIWENPKGLIGRRERFLENHRLTEKEKEMTRLILKGLSNQEISSVSGNSLATVKFYSSQIYEKFAVKSRAELFNLVFPT